MVAGHLTEKKGYYYAVINFKDGNGKRKTKWFSTGLKVEGNKRKADSFLTEIRCKFDVEKENSKSSEAMNALFSDFLEEWLKVVKSTIAVTTYSSYCGMVRKIIAPYFKNKRTRLKNLKAKDIQDFYLIQLERVKATSVIHYHAVIHKALKYAVKIDLIDVNPSDNVELPRREKYMANYYKAEEINKMLELSKSTKLEIPLIMASFYGLRRSEVIGLKWDAIDFESNIITINHTVTKVNIDGHSQLVMLNSAKSRSSLRSLPLVPFIKRRLEQLKEEQDQNRKKYGRSYNKAYIGYLCVNETGDIISPDNLTKSFKLFLKRNDLKEIRFHDLRHSCASLLLANGVPMKQIQEWLGHSDYSTTANYYAHLDFNSKWTSANAILSGLGYDND